MKTFILSLFVVSTLCGCNGTVGLYVGRLTKTFERSGYKTVTSEDDRFAIEATPTPSGKFVVVNGLAASPIYFERLQQSLTLPTARNDRSYDERLPNNDVPYSVKTDFASGNGTYSATYIDLKVTGSETIEDGDTKKTTTITWDFWGTTTE